MANLPVIGYPAKLSNGTAVFAFYFYLTINFGQVILTSASSSLKGWENYQSQKVIARNQTIYVKVSWTINPFQMFKIFYMTRSGHRKLNPM